jgi:hypothetical protein
MSKVGLDSMSTQAYLSKNICYTTQEEEIPGCSRIQLSRATVKDARVISRIYGLTQVCGRAGCASGCLGMSCSCSSTWENRAMLKSQVVMRLSCEGTEVTLTSVEEV